MRLFLRRRLPLCLLLLVFQSDHEGSDLFGFRSQAVDCQRIALNEFNPLFNMGSVLGRVGADAGVFAKQHGCDLAAQRAFGVFLRAGRVGDVQVQAGRMPCPPGQTAQGSGVVAIAAVKRRRIGCVDGVVSDAVARMVAGCVLNLRARCGNDCAGVLTGGAGALIRLLQRRQTVHLFGVEDGGVIRLRAFQFVALVVGVTPILDGYAALIFAHLRAHRPRLGVGEPARVAAPLHHQMQRVCALVSFAGRGVDRQARAGLLPRRLPRPQPLGELFGDNLVIRFATVFNVVRFGGFSVEQRA